MQQLVRLERELIWQFDMKRWILKRSNGQVVSICDQKPRDFGNLEMLEIEITEQELEKVKSAVSLKEEGGELISSDSDHIPVEIRKLVEKVKNGKSLNATEKDELLLTLISRVLY